jgi:hypothetical protein
MPFCSSCGSEFRGDVKFCASCGQPTAQPATAAATPPAAPETPPVAPPVQPAGAPGYYPPPPPPPPSGPRRSLKWVWIGSGAAAAVIIAIVLVLVLVVFNGDDEDVVFTTTTTAAGTVTTGQGGFTGTSALPPTTATTAADSGDNKGEAKEVEKVVRMFFKAMEDQDWGKFIDLMDPTLMGAIPEGETRDAAIAAIASSLTSLGTMKFEGLEFKVEMTSPTTATVTLTAGKATITDAAGNKTTEDVKDSGDSAGMEMKKVDGKWYIATSAFL